MTIELAVRIITAYCVCAAGVELGARHVRWSTSKGSPFVPSPLLYGEQLYTINDMASIVTSFEATTGRVMWQGRLGEA